MINNNFNNFNKIFNLFLLSSNIGKGLIIWLNNALIIKKKIKKILLNLYNKKNFFLVETPHIGLNKLYITSGHFKKYKNNFFDFNKTSFYNLKPMNCPHHCYIVKHLKPNLPFRILEFSNVYRYEKTGELKNIFRTRSFIQDDCHIFCEKKHIYKEINEIYYQILYILYLFNFKKYKIYLSLKNKSNKYIKNKFWKYSENILLNFLKKKHIKVKIIKGEAAFYGPKIDFMVKDSLGKYWQLSTIQLDYNLSLNFKINYIKNIIIIHRALLGSFERFIGLLLDNNKGSLPIWLSFIHLSIIPINLKFIKFAKKIKKIIINKININIKIKYYNILKNNFFYYLKKSEHKQIPFIMLIGYKESKNISYTLKKNKKIIIFNKIKKLIKYLKNNINKLSYVNFKKKYK